MAKKTKTNACRILDRQKIAYTIHEYYDTEATSGTEVARILGEEENRIFKTLVLQGKSGDHYVMVIPSPCVIDLKKAATAVGEKSIAMIPQKELEPLTGYVHGGCSPVGMKKTFRTLVHPSARDFKTIFISGGRIGLQLEIDVQDLEKAIPLEYEDMTGSLK